MLPCRQPQPIFFGLFYREVETQHTGFKVHHYPFHISDFNNATRHLTRIERSIYRDLIDLYYHTEKALSGDVSLLCRLIIANDCSTDVQRVLNEFFFLAEDGLFYNHYCEQVIAKYHAQSDNQSKAGKASAKARALKAAQDKASEHPFNGRSTGVQRAFNQPEPEPEPEPINIKKNIIIPDGININAWSEWIEFRKAKRKPVSKIAANKQFKMLLKYDLKTQQEIINNSITSDYQGLFEPRGKNENSTRNNGEYIDNSAAGRVRAEVEKRREGRRNLANDGQYVRTQVGVELRTED